MRCSKQPISLRAELYGTPSASSCFRRITPVLMLPTTRRPSTPGPFSPEYRGEGETFAQWFPVEAAVGDLRSNGSRGAACAATLGYGMVCRWRKDNLSISDWRLIEANPGCDSLAQRLNSAANLPFDLAIG